MQNVGGTNKSIVVFLILGLYCRRNAVGASCKFAIILHFYTWHLQAADRISCDSHPKVFIYPLHSGSTRNNIGKGQNRSRKEVRDEIRRLIMGFRKECISAWLPSE